MSTIIKDMIVNYTGVNRTAEHTWDYIQKTVRLQSFLPVLYSRLRNLFCIMTQVNCKNGSFCEFLPQDYRSGCVAPFSGSLDINHFLCHLCATDLETSIFYHNYWQTFGCEFCGLSWNNLDKLCFLSQPAAGCGTIRVFFIYFRTAAPVALVSSVWMF